MSLFSDVEYSTQTISAAAAVVTLDGDELPILMTDISFNFTRNLQPIYPINAVNGERRLIKVSSAPQGALHIGSIIAANSDSLTSFLEKVAKPCTEADEGVALHFQPFADGCGAGNQAFTLKNVSLKTVAVGLQGGGQSVITFGTDYDFTGLDLK